MIEYILQEEFAIREMLSNFIHNFPWLIVLAFSFPIALLMTIYDYGDKEKK